MNVLLIGGGGRECALAHKIAESKALTNLYVDSINPGFPNASKHTEDIWDLDLDLVVVGPEKPLSEGIADKFIKLGVPVFGPTKLGAKLETSKCFAKQIMKKINIPTAKYKSFSGSTRFMEAAKHIEGPCVIKVDGIASGKGVYVCKSKKEALGAINDINTGKFGISATTILIEEVLKGTRSVYASNM